MAGIETVLIAGPTASGKSALAAALAKRLGGAVVNADSMQVYKELRVLSARPSDAEMDDVAHHLFGHVSALQPYSVAHWLTDAQAAIAAIHASGQVAVITGGTGLYFKALTEGLEPAPSSTAAVRAESRARRETLGISAFYDELVTLDPKAARLHAADSQRVLRAWEVVTLVGSGAGYGGGRSEPVALGRSVRVVLDVDRPTLYRRIDHRFDAMMGSGALNEARAFWELNPDAAAPAAKALGLPSLKRFLGGAISLEAAVDEAKRESRRYAKRQGTWFRNQTRGWARLDATDQSLGLLEGAVLATEVDDRSVKGCV